MPLAPYTCLAHDGESLLKDRASKFYAYAFPCSSMDVLDAKLAELKKIHPKARHFCWASRMGQPLEERAQDAGEPVHSAGTPILHALQSAGVEQSAAIVIRYFGGTKLGVSGLIHAYRTSAMEAIQQAGTVEVVPRISVHCSLPYSALGSLEALMRQHQGSMRAQKFGTACELILELPELEWARFAAQLEILPEVQWRIQEASPTATT